MQFSRLLDDRICRLPLEEEERAALAGKQDAVEDQSVAGSRTGVGAARCARKKRVRRGMGASRALGEVGGVMHSGEKPQDAGSTPNVTHAKEEDCDL